MKGITRVQCACLLLLLLSAVVLSQTFEEFKKQHILPEGSKTCNDMMKKINKENTCKPINTFLKEKVASIKALCEDKKNDTISHTCDIIDCKRTSEEPCKYKNLDLKDKKVTIKCENGLPVHLQETKRQGF